jgi:hypothetical protein
MNQLYEDAKRIRRGRKALARLAKICQEVGVTVSVPHNAEEKLRDAELELVEDSLRCLQPRDILQNLGRFRVFTYR